MVLEQIINSFYNFYSGNLTMPSIVAYPSKSDTTLVGESARDMIRPIENIVYGMVALVFITFT